MGEEQGRLTGLGFNAAIRVEARDERLTDVAGAVLVREALARTGALGFLAKHLQDARRADAITHPMLELLLTRVSLVALGRQDQDDADVMRADPALRLAVSERRGDSPLRNDPAQRGRANPPVPQGLASQPTQSRLVKQLSTTHNRSVLSDTVFEQGVRRLLRVNDGRKHKRLTMDLDGFPVEVAGHQSGSAYNGYYKGCVFHPLVAVVGETGDLLGVMLRRGNAHAAQDFVSFVTSLVEKLVGRVCESVLVRIDAGMVSDEALVALEAAGIDYIARVKNNSWLDREAAPHLRRPVGRRPDEPREWTHEHTLHPKAWSKPRRTVLVVQERPDELYLHHFWLVTSLRTDQRDAEEMLERYRRRGCAESHIGEFRDVLDPHLSSAPRGRFSFRPFDFIGPLRAEDSPDFTANEVTLLIHALAYNAMHALRSILPLQATEEAWSLRRLRERVLCVAGRVLLHGRRVTLVVTTATSRHWHDLWQRLRGLDNLALAR
jgi:hypothetical protein